jgi:transketolase
MTYEDQLIELLQHEDKYIVLTAENRAAIRKLPNLVKRQFIDTGITEQSMVGIAAGLALRGRIPIVHALAAFLTMRAFEFIRTDIGIGNLPVKIVGSVAGLLSEANGPTHQAIEDISLIRGIPNINIFAPSDEADLLRGIPKVLSSKSPFYIRFNTLPSHVVHSKFEIGLAEVFGKGTSVAILVYGTLFNQAFIAKDILESRGLSVRLLNMRTLKPIDEDEILKAVDECDMIVTVEDHFLTGGLYSILCELLVRSKRTANVVPFGLKERWFKPALLEDVLNHEGFSGKQLAARIEEKFSENKKTDYYAEWSNV